jgi:hypothetical protein
MPFSSRHLVECHRSPSKRKFAYTADTLSLQVSLSTVDSLIWLHAPITLRLRGEQGLDSKDIL